MVLDWKIERFKVWKIESLKVWKLEMLWNEMKWNEKWKMIGWLIVWMFECLNETMKC